MRRAGTKFLLIHTGYPAHHIVSSLISQYPNVYVDLSHYSVDVSWLNAGILAEYLSLSSPNKVMHGTDTAHPDVTAFGAHNTRVGLAKYAEWLYEVEHWSDSEITDLAGNMSCTKTPIGYSPISNRRRLLIHNCVRTKYDP